MCSPCNEQRIFPKDSPHGVSGVGKVAQKGALMLLLHEHLLFQIVDLRMRTNADDEEFVTLVTSQDSTV